MRETSRIRERIRNRQPTRVQAPMRGRELVGYLTLTALVALPAVFGLWQQNVYVQTRFEIEALRKEKLALQERYRCLRIESATLESLGRIGQEARKIGLVPRREASSPIFITPIASSRPVGLAGRTGGTGAPAPAVEGRVAAPKRHGATPGRASGETFMVSGAPRPDANRDLSRVEPSL